MDIIASCLNDRFNEMKFASKSSFDIKNSGYLYRCENVRYLGCFIYAPTENVTKFDLTKGAPSSDAIDLDVCKNVLIHGEVNALITKL